jgi:hypothetical protein
MKDEHQALWNLTTRVRDLVLERSSEAPSLVVVVSSTTDLIEGCIDGVATNGVHCGAWLALTAVLSHFPDLELEFKLLGSRYNANPTKDEMDVFWTQTHW